MIWRILLRNIILMMGGIFCFFAYCTAVLMFFGLLAHILPDPICGFLALVVLGGSLATLIGTLTTARDSDTENALEWINEKFGIR